MWLFIAFLVQAAIAVALGMVAASPFGWAATGWCAGLAFSSLTQMAFNR